LLVACLLDCLLACVAHTFLTVWEREKSGKKAQTMARVHVDVVPW
jgi:hypothetical protein